MTNSDIQGTIVDHNGTPISGVTVYLFNQDNPNQVITTTTDNNGDYIFDGHPDGDGNSANWYVTTAYDDGSNKFNTVAKPYVSSQLPPAIPDSEELHARYDATALSASDGQSVSTWPDEANANDLNEGTAPTFKTSQINGNAVVRFDGADDYLEVDWSDISQPVTIFIVAQFQSLSGSSVERVWGNVSGSTHLFGNQNASNYRLYAGSGLQSNSTPDTSAHIISTLSNGGSSIIRIDGAQDASGDAGTASLNSFRVGAGPDLNYANVDVGEILVYPQDKSAKWSEIESYLSDKWGITI